MNPSSIDQHGTNRIVHAHDLPSAERVQTDSAGAENGNLVSPPDYVSVSGTIELLQMMLEVSQTDRKSKRELERSADQAATAAEKSQVKELRAEADEKLTAAIVSGSIAIAGSVANGVASVASLRGSGLNDAAGATRDLAKATNDPGLLDQATKLSTEARSWNKAGTLIGAGATVMKDTAKPIEGSITYAASGHGIEAKEAEHRANALRRSADSLKSDIDNIRQHDSKLFDLVREVESAMNRCTQIALQSR